MKCASSFACAVLAAGVLAASWSSAGGQVGQPLSSRGPELRRWTDSTGRFHTDATLIGGDRVAVRLQKKSTGSVITVAVKRLSAADQQFVRASFPSAAESVDPIAAGISYLAKKPVVADAISIVRSAPLLAQPSAQVPQNMIYVRLSRPFLRRVVQREVHQRGPVNDFILGATITGTSDTTGSTEILLQPNSQQGQLELHFSGVVNYRTVAYSGPVQVFANGAARFAAAKAVRIDQGGIAAGPAATNVLNASTITGVQSSLRGLFGRIARRIGARRAAADQSLADAIGGRHIERQVSESFDQIADAEIAKAWANLQAQLAALPANDPLRPSAWQVSTTADALQIVVLGRAGGERVPAPEQLYAQSDVVVQVHAAAVSRALGDEHLRKLLQPTGMQAGAAAGSPPAGGPTMSWSADRCWLSICWRQISLPGDEKPESATHQSPPVAGAASAILVDRLPR